MQAGHAYRPGAPELGVVAGVALADAAFALQEEGTLAGDAELLGRAGAALAGRVTALAVAVLVELDAVAAGARLRRA